MFFGAELGSLSIDTSVLSNAHVQCLLPESGTVRVGIGGLEVVFATPRHISAKNAEILTNAAWVALQSTDPAVLPVQHRLTFSAWAAIEGARFSDVISRFVKPLPDMPEPRVHVSWTTLGSDTVPPSFVAIEEAQDVPGDLFLQIRASFPGELALDKVSAAFLDQMTRSVASLGFKLDPRS